MSEASRGPKGSGSTLARHCDVIVVGAGGIGSGVFYHLARHGVKVCAVEQFSPVHDRGSSHGETRIIRKAYFEHPDYMPLLHRTYELWAELEAETGSSLLTQCGFLAAGDPGAESLDRLRSCYRQHQLPHEYWDAGEIKHHFPQFRFKEDVAAFFDPLGGYLDVEGSVRAHLDAGVQAGGRLHVGERVIGWHEEPGGVTLRTEKRTLRADRCIFCAGAWSPALLPDFPVGLHLSRRVVFWHSPGDAADFTAANFPSFYYETGPYAFYGCPAVNRFGVKVGEHRVPFEIENPEEKEREISAAERSAVRGFVSSVLPGLEGEPTRFGTCLYTLSPDEQFIIDALPGHERVLIACGFSGHGFKFAPVVGEALMEIVIHGRTQHPIGFLALNRFAPLP